MTPLTRQVMTKSIHRAILEYQHSHHGAIVSPKSPLDLRVRASVLREGNGHNSKTENLAPKSADKSRASSTSIVSKADSVESKVSPLETVYEQEKDANAYESEDFDYGNYVTHDAFDVIKNANPEQSIVNELLSADPIGETPVLVSRKLSNEKIGGADKSNREIWYTPKEFVQARVIENIEVSFEF